jgi:hypothetical protein
VEGNRNIFLRASYLFGHGYTENPEIISFETQCANIDKKTISRICEKSEHVLGKGGSGPEWLDSLHIYTSFNVNGKYGGCRSTISYIHCEGFEGLNLDKKNLGNADRNCQKLCWAYTMMKIVAPCILDPELSKHVSDAMEKIQSLLIPTKPG